MTAKSSAAAPAAAAADAEAAEPLKGGAKPKGNQPADEVLVKSGSLANGHPHPRKTTL